MQDEVQTRIDLYPGDLSLEDVPAVFSLAYERPDDGVGFDGGIWATLEHITVGGKTLPREDVLLMIGCKAMTQIEADISEWQSREPSRIAAE